MQPSQIGKRQRIYSPKPSESGSSSSNDTASKLLKQALKAEPLPEIESMVQFLEDVDLDDDDDDDESQS